MVYPSGTNPPRLSWKNAKRLCNCCYWGERSGAGVEEMAESEPLPLVLKRWQKGSHFPFIKSLAVEEERTKHWMISLMGIGTLTLPICDGKDIWLVKTRATYLQRILRK